MTAKGKTKLKKRKQNRLRFPHRGIIAEIARELNIKPPSVWEAIEVTKNPKMLELYAQKLNERVSRQREAESKYNQAIENALT